MLSYITVMCAMLCGAQVMEEGERLSKKQLAQENTIKKLRAQLEEARADKGSAAASLAGERSKVCNTPVTSARRWSACKGSAHYRFWYLMVHYARSFTPKQIR